MNKYKINGPGLGNTTFVEANDFGHDCGFVVFYVKNKPVAAYAAHTIISVVKQ